MKKYLLFTFLLTATAAFSQKIVFNEVGFKLKEKDRALIERLATYEVKIFNGLFNTNENDSLVLKLNLYNKQKAFNEVLKTSGSKGLTESCFYSPTKNESYVLYYDTKEMHTVLHELSHALLRNNLKYPSRWFNEGLATFLQSLEEKNNNIQVYAQHYYLNYVRELNKLGKINIRRFLFEEQNKWRNKDDLKYMYGMSYSIIYFMVQRDPSYIGKMATMMQNREKTETIFIKLFGSLENFEYNFKIHYR